MTLTEIVAKLKAFANSMKLAPVGDAMGFDESDAVWLDAAITHLDPYTQPITPERLEAAGFDWDQLHGLWLYRNIGSHEFVLAWREEDGMRRWTPRAGNITSYPGVRSMGHVLSLVEMLEGGDGA